MDEYLNKRYLEWQLKTNSKQSYQSFAKYLGVSYTTMMGWINGVHPPKGENLRKLAKVLGDEIYDVAGEPRPDSELSPKEAAALSSALELIRGIDPDTEDGIERIRKIFADFGLTIRSIR